MDEMSELGIVITHLSKNQLDVCCYKGYRRGALMLGEGKWSYHDRGNFKLNSGELCIIAKKLDELNGKEPK